MADFELPLGKRSKFYRFFEMVPAILSYGAFALLIVLSIFSPLLAAIYLLVVIITLLVKSFGISYHTIRGHQRLVRAMKVDWATRLNDMEDPIGSYERLKDTHSREYGALQHVENLRLAAADPAAFPKPSKLHHLIIIAAYNEDYDVLEPTIQSVADAHYDKQKFVVALAYEERGGAEIEKTARRLEKKFKGTFLEFVAIKHPRDLPNEVVGKGANITYAGKQMRPWFDQRGIAYRDVMVTTLDSDNRPHPSYFAYTAYEYIVNEDRKSR